MTPQWMMDPGLNPGFLVSGHTSTFLIYWRFKGCLFLRQPLPLIETQEIFWRSSGALNVSRIEVEGNKSLYIGTDKVNATDFVNRRLLKCGVK